MNHKVAIVERPKPEVRDINTLEIYEDELVPIEDGYTIRASVGGMILEKRKAGNLRDKSLYLGCGFDYLLVEDSESCEVLLVLQKGTLDRLKREGVNPK